MIITTLQFQFATKFELFLIFMGVILSCLNAFSLPLVIIIYGEFTTLLVERNYVPLDNSTSATTSQTYLLNLFGGGKEM